MKCQNCGTENKDGAKFCKKCGATFDKPVEQSVATPKSSSKRTVLIVVGVLVLAIALALAYIVFLDVSPVEVEQLTTANSGNVLQNPHIASNIPDSNISDTIVQAANSGVPVYRIGDGSGPVTVICAGVHGDQLVPTVAAMDLIDYLDGRKIRGTVYIIPFASPQAVSENTKLTNGVNLNTVADEEGTVSNLIVDFAISHNATAVGDFHETEVGKNPGITTIMCSQVPTYGSYMLARDMSELTLDTTFTYTLAGIAYDGAIEDECNLAGTPAVTPLVVVGDHGQVSQAAVRESYDQMLAMLIANGNLDYDDAYLKLANSDIDGF